MAVLYPAHHVSEGGACAARHAAAWIPSTWYTRMKLMHERFMKRNDFRKGLAPPCTYTVKRRRAETFTGETEGDVRSQCLIRPVRDVGDVRRGFVGRAIRIVKSRDKRAHGSAPRLLHHYVRTRSRGECSLLASCLRLRALLCTFCTHCTIAFVAVRCVWTPGRVATRSKLSTNVQVSCI